MNSLLDVICSRALWCPREVFGSVLQLAVEIADEGREGRPVGTLFVVGNADAVMTSSRPLILDPLAGHTPAATHVMDPKLRGTIKALAQLDGAFVVNEDGIVVAACRYLDAHASDVEVPLGLGSRHLAAAAMSRQHDVIAVVVSQSRVIRVFYTGHLCAELRPGENASTTRRVISNGIV